MIILNKKQNTKFYFIDIGRVVDVYNKWQNLLYVKVTPDLWPINDLFFMC